VELPGGLWENGRCRKAFAFRPVTGALELALADSGNGRPMAVRITEALSAALEHLGGEAATPERVAACCIPDRHFLLRRLQIHAGRGKSWLQATCSACAQPFDFYLDVEALPVRPAKRGYPFASLRIGEVDMRFRIPTGSDQQAIIGMESDAEAQWGLLRRCWVPEKGRGSAKDWKRFRLTGAEGFARVESALESVAPELVSGVQAPCPQCGHSNEVSLDPHAVLRQGVGEVLREVHLLAFHYHWSEADILGLGRPRRHHYLRLIDQSRGMAA
jgi:hypothetical protein